MAKISGIDSSDDNTEKRLQAYQQYYTYMQNNQPAQSTETDDSASEGSGDTSEQAAKDSYQKSTTIATGAVYNSKGKRAIDLTAYTKTKFVSQSPPDVTADMSSQLFNSLDEDKDRLLESDEYSKNTSLRKEPVKDNAVSDL